MDAIVKTLEARLESSEPCGELLFDPKTLSDDACFLEYMTAVSDRMTASQLEACRRIRDRAERKRKR